MSAPPTPGGPFGPGLRGLTVGLLLAVTANALTALALVTIAPRIPAELGGLHLYGWLFSAYLLASLFGTVWGGALADRRGLRAPFAIGLTVFAVGLASAGLAPSMPWVIAARVLQGFGAGAVTTCVYVAITRAYPDGQRAHLMALLSSAWVTPALVGPAAAGAVTEAFGWRWVFLGLVPVLVLVGALTLPRLGLARAGGVETARGRATRASKGVPGPRGALRGALAAVSELAAAPGLGALVAARGAFFAAFIGVEAYLALMLTDLLGLTSASTGGVIALGAIGWTVGSWWQARRDGAAGGPGRRGRRVVVGTNVLGCGLAAQGIALAVSGSDGGAAAAVAIAAFGWCVAGFGIGVAHATSSVRAFALADRGGVAPGRVSAALQLGDNVGAALVTGAAGALLAFVAVADPAAAAGPDAEALRLGVAAAFGVSWAAWALSSYAARRSDRPARSRPARP